jgi:hypothetical protein
MPLLRPQVPFRLITALQGDRLAMRSQAERLRALPGLLAAVDDQIAAATTDVASCRDAVRARQTEKKPTVRAERLLRKARTSLDNALAEKQSLTSERGKLDEARAVDLARGDYWPGVDGLAPVARSAEEAIAVYAKRQAAKRQAAECPTRDR